MYQEQKEESYPNKGVRGLSDLQSSDKHYYTLQVKPTEYTYSFCNDS